MPGSRTSCRIQEFCTGTDGLPLEEGVDRHDAAPTPIGVPKHWELCHRLSLRVDGRRLWPVLRPVRDQSPTEHVERAHAGVGMLADRPEFLRWRGVVAGWEVRRRAVIRTLKRIHNLEPELIGAACLNDTSAHRFRSPRLRVSASARYRA